MKRENPLVLLLILALSCFSFAMSGISQQKQESIKQKDGISIGVNNERFESKLILVSSPEAEDYKTIDVPVLGYEPFD